MKIKKRVFFGVFFLGQAVFAHQNFCAKDTLKDFKKISREIAENTSALETLYAEKLKLNEIIVTGENKTVILIANQPQRVEFTIYPNSQVKILKLSDEKCGLEIEMNGKVFSAGAHLDGNRCVEMQTAEAEIIPEGTSYLAETGALNNAVAELNEEAGLDPGMSGTQERFTVKKGSIQVRLKKHYTKGLRIKHTKVAKNKSKKIKTKSKMFTYNNDKIKLKSSMTLKIKKNRKLKQQVADLEIIIPE